ncbi:hypothetical protein E2C01_081954 [Portunus trituberculatus]|uniref:Uncharacterized protein n=1 Tax=Portunus trituberculatus TaxID=210409 RepID=A0A5B7IXZ5_PORTR|nr:hypothetical protein [Portunus trituberculatus]
MAASPAFLTVSADCVSSPILVMKASEVEAEFHRRISEAEFCRVNSAHEGVAAPTVSLPSNETQGQEAWRVVSSDAKRRKVLRAPQRVETTNSCAVLEGVEEERERRQEVTSQVKHLDAAFIDNWDLGKDTFYARDGVHLSRQGVQVLAGTLEGELNELRRFFR